jgi:hypothetical protein
MISEFPVEENGHGGYFTLILYEISDTGECKKLCKEISINDLQDDMNRGPETYKAGFLSTKLKYCGVTKGLIGKEMGYMCVFTLFTH